MPENVHDSAGGYSDVTLQKKPCTSGGKHTAVGLAPESTLLPDVISALQKSRLLVCQADR
jgi:hypothetical protein